MKYPRIEGAHKLGSFIKPMLAELSTSPAFNDNQWVFEIKWDGYRAIAEASGKESRLYSRKGTSFAKAFPGVFDEIKKLATPVVLDGEIVVFDSAGRPSFQLLQNYDSRTRLPIQFQVFDILSLKGKDLTNLPLLERKSILKEFLVESAVVRFCDHVETEGALFFEQIIRMDLEGMIAKKASSRYLPGERSREWLKIKNHKFDDFFILGFLHSDSEAYLKSLILGGIENGKLQYRGCVSGFTDRTVREMRKMLNKDVTSKKPVDKHEKFIDPVSWVTPRYKVNVRYTEITTDGIIRHPVFMGVVKA